MNINPFKIVFLLTQFPILDHIHCLLNGKELKNGKISY